MITKEELLKLLRQEVVPALGCTEPIAIAYAGAVARRLLGTMPERCTVSCSGNIVKNVMGVTVPNSGGQRGIAVAATLGIVGGDPDQELAVLNGITEQQREEVRDLLDSEVDATSVTRAVRDMLKDTTDILPTADVIIDEVCKFFSVGESALRGQSRAKEIATPRHIAIYLIRNMTKLSLSDIGKEFGNRNHTTVINSVDRVEKLCKEDPATAEILKDIRTNINDRYG